MNKRSFIGISLLLIAAGVFFFFEHPKLGGVMIIVGIIGLLLAIDFKELKKVPLKLRSDTIMVQKYKKPGKVIKVIEKTRRRYKIVGEAEEYYFLRVRLGEKKIDIPVDEELADQLKPEDLVDVFVKVYRDRDKTVLETEMIEAKRGPKLAKKKPDETANKAEKSANT